MWKDPIVEEVRRVRDEHAARFGYDIDAIFEDIRKSERESGRLVLSPPDSEPKVEPESVTAESLAP